MSDRVHIGDALGRMMQAPGSIESDWAKGRRAAFIEVRDGHVFTDADVKVDQLYRALAATQHWRDTAVAWECIFCGVRLPLAEIADGHYRPSQDKSDHELDCLYVEAVEYVTNNPKEET